MNGQSDYVQTSSFDWGSRTHPMLHERRQVDATISEVYSQTSVLDDLEHQMAQFAAEFEAQMAQLSKNYVMAGDHQVERFTRNHRTLSQLLLEAVPHLKHHFGADAIFHLRAPIDEGGAQTLYAVVMWPGTAKDVRTRLKAFDDEWWFGLLNQASGHLTFTYELI